jgi:hypothetical protein
MLAILAAHEEPAIASVKLHENVSGINEWGGKKKTKKKKH